MALLAIAALSSVVVACGAEEETELVDGEEVHAVVEGEPLELGELSFNVALTRFLNPEDTEDAEYLRDLAPPPLDTDYLAIFMVVKNEGDEDRRLPSAVEMRVEDTTGAEYTPTELDPVFGLDLGGIIEAGGEAPDADTAAASGPTQGAILLFLVDQEVSSNRPLDLIILAEGEEGLVELDI
ncbi:MAG: hypothetical protein M3O25_08935 [Actinomycetota bacterium]|nr:hypothetical protein [Actinomycetota bacterium]